MRDMARALENGLSPKKLLGSLGSELHVNRQFGFGGLGIDLRPLVVEGLHNASLYIYVPGHEHQPPPFVGVEWGWVVGAWFGAGGLV